MLIGGKLMLKANCLDAMANVQKLIKCGAFDEESRNCDG